MTNQSIMNKNTSSELTIAHIVYLLQALVFFTLITFVIGVVLNYVKKDDVTESWLATHYRWQIQTFWYGLLFSILGCVLILVVIGYFILLGVMIWIIYRIIKGWIRLSEHRAVG